MTKLKTETQLPQAIVRQSVILNELRIGNTIHFIICDTEDSKLDEYKKINISASDFEFIRDNNSLFEGILLTKDMLLNFGFIKDNEETEMFYKKIKYDSQYLEIWENYDEENNNLFVCYITNDLINQTNENSDPIFLDTINYIHQLQNLYFALTGRELTVA